jgi:hypothetical protein
MALSIPSLSARQAPAPSVRPNLVSLDLGGRVERATSRYDLPYGPYKLLDDDPSTVWTSSSNAFPQEIVLAFAGRDTALVSDVTVTFPQPGTDPGWGGPNDGKVWAKDVEIDGAIEDAVLAGGAPVVSTARLLAAARASGVAIDAHGAAAAGWPADARARQRLEEGPGIAVVGPATPVEVDGERRTAWWRIDTATGDTVGVLDSGLHGTEIPSNALLWAFVGGRHPS